MSLPAFAIGALAVGAGLSARPIVQDVFGIGRTVTNLNSGNCQTIPELRGCEDLWMHHESGLLYAACSDPAKRLNWTPATGLLNAEGRPLDDALYVLDTNKPASDASRIVKVKTPGFSGVAGDGTINLHGIGAHVLPAAAGEPQKVRLFLNNHRPPLGQDSTKVGANSTVELFETVLGSDTMQHIRTYADPLIATPNRVAPVDADSFIVSNDHAVKTGFLRTYVAVFTANSFLTYCDPKGCNVAYQGGAMPNGIVRSSQSSNRYVVPYSLRGFQTLFDFDATSKTLQKVADIPVGMPTDNLYVAASGDVYTASFPRLLETDKSMHAAHDKRAYTPSASFRIPAADIATGGANGWHVEKVYEDDGGLITSVTSVAMDEKHKELYLTGLVGNHIAVCKMP